MKEPKTLLNELLGGSDLETFREQSLQSGLAALRGANRRRRLVRRGVAAAAALAVVLLMIAVTRLPSERVEQAASSAPAQQADAPPVSVPPSIEIIDDEELFALFPDRSLALVGPPGNQQLIFLDEVSGTAN